MKTTIFVKTRERHNHDNKYPPFSYIIDVEGEFNADNIKKAVKSCIGNPYDWYIDDIKILATNQGYEPKQKK